VKSAALSGRRSEIAIPAQPGLDAFERARPEARSPEEAIIRIHLSASLLALMIAVPALAETASPGFPALEASQAAANSQPGARSLPAHTVPVPQADVSPAAQALAAAPYRVPAWNANPPDDAGWRTLVAKLADGALPGLAKAREQLGVTMEATTVGGVKAFVFTPRTMPEAHRNQVIFNIHGGGYVYGPGESGTAEAMLMSALGGYRVIAVDYRMPPDAPYPAAMDDTMAAWRAVAATTDPRRIGVVGTSTGGGMTRQRAARLGQHHRGGGKRGPQPVERRAVAADARTGTRPQMRGMAPDTLRSQLARRGPQVPAGRGRGLCAVYAPSMRRLCAVYAPSMRQRIDVADFYRNARSILPESMDGQPPLPAPDDCPVTLDELLAASRP